MADITLCTYLGCPVRDKCKRSTTKNLSEVEITNPSRIVHGKFECDLFWGDPADLFFEQLKSIMNDKTKGNNTDT